MHPLATRPIDAAPAVIAWDECACLLCRVSDYTPLLESTDLVSKSRFLIVRCNRCGLCFTNPRPDLVSMQPFYPDEYRCHRRQPTKRRRHPDPLAKVLPPRGQARLLDFGCGAGAFLERMHALGWNVTGLDASESAVAQIRERGLTAHVGTLPQPHWKDGSFDVITMWQALEHSHHPLDVLQEAHRLLAPDGTLLVAVPNFDGWAARYFGADWYGLDLPRHLTHFTPATLQSMLANAGFVGAQVRQESHPSWIRHSARRHGGTFARLLRSRFGSNIACWYARMTRQSEGLLVIAKK